MSILNRVDYMKCKTLHLDWALYKITTFIVIYLLLNSVKIKTNYYK